MILGDVDGDAAHVARHELHMPIASAAIQIAAAARTARSVLSNKARNPSPVVSISRPR